MKIAYFDCAAGAAGDMIAAAMIGAGLDREFLKTQLATLGIEKLDIQIGETDEQGIKATTFKPVWPKQHEHRHLKHIVEIISKSQISGQAKKTAIAIFTKLAQAEAKVHGEDIEKIHFHEVGAVDAIADIVSAAVGLEYLKQSGVEKIYCSTISVGGGTVECAHGVLAVPAPATAELIKGVPVKGGPVEKELLTPTGAAVLVTIVDEFGEMPAMEIETIGSGAGTLKSEGLANVLRLIVGEAVVSDETSDSVCLLETNVDDATGELVGFVIDKLMDAGALDAFSRAIVMKQGRPGVMVSVLCEVGDIEKFERVLFGQGLTLGVRRQILKRSKLARSTVEVVTEFGQIDIKTGLLDGEVVSIKPEFAQCRAAAEKHGVAVKVVLDAAIRAYEVIK